ncbi:hypothetical protein Ahy_A06g029676 isoform A [Arachis hypogaea]|uniref:CCHC-type domain-containing protein n=1 Tax=Arachis hypogaea TaxID=3818 RepID=A0A445CU32_ARAHY|nr:hypothetical protein Ahy_A06g029676 isoform A [Arachis hypogaea]
MITSHYLIVQRLRPFFLASKNINHRFLSRVGSTLSTLLKIDCATSVHFRGCFAKICVELDISIKLVPKILVLRQILNVEYEGLHLICFTCGKYGHRSDQCSETHDSKVAPENTIIDGKEGSPGFAGGERVNHTNIIGKVNQDPPKFGPSMKVKRQVRKKSTGSRGANYKKDSPSNLEAKTSNRSRFNILDEGITKPSHEKNVHDEYCGCKVGSLWWSKIGLAS